MVTSTCLFLISVPTNLLGILGCVKGWYVNVRISWDTISGNQPLIPRNTRLSSFRVHSHVFIYFECTLPQKFCNLLCISILSIGWLTSHLQGSLRVLPFMIVADQTFFSGFPTIPSICNYAYCSVSSFWIYKTMDYPEWIRSFYNNPESISISIQHIFVAHSQTKAWEIIRSSDSDSFVLFSCISGGAQRVTTPRRCRDLSDEPLSKSCSTVPPPALSRLWRARQTLMRNVLERVCH